MSVLISMVGVTKCVTIWMEVSLALALKVMSYNPTILHALVSYCFKNVTVIVTISAI